MDTITNDLIAWYQKNRRDLPWRKTYNSYYIWISEIMLQQTRVEAVIHYYERFIARFPTLKIFAEASEDEILKYWEGLGYYSRVRNMHKTAKILTGQGMDALPNSKDELLKLPGIGEYTAGAILSIAYDIPAPAIDGNVYRVLGRYYAIDVSISKNEGVSLYKSHVNRILPNKDAGDFTQSFMDLGSMVCLPKNPKCDICPLKGKCIAFKNQSMEKYPVKDKKVPQKVEERCVYLFVFEDKVAILKRPDKGLLASMYEFPNVLATLSDIDVENDLIYKEIPYVSIHGIGEAKHVFSHIIWLMQGYVIEVKEPLDGYLWVTKKELLAKYSIPSAFLYFTNFFLNR